MESTGIIGWSHRRRCEDNGWSTSRRVCRIKENSWQPTFGSLTVWPLREVRHSGLLVQQLPDSQASFAARWPFNICHPFTSRFWMVLSITLSSDGLMNTLMDSRSMVNNRLQKQMYLYLAGAEPYMGTVHHDVFSILGGWLHPVHRSQKCPQFCTKLFNGTSLTYHWIPLRKSDKYQCF